MAIRHRVSPCSGVAAVRSLAVACARTPARHVPRAALRPILCVCCVLGLLCVGVPTSPSRVDAQTDLDAFMQKVLAQRDDNWRKLQQYILDESDQLQLRGPSHRPIWGEQRDYTWFIRDGFFVRSPVRFNGVTIGDAERRKAEDEYLRWAQRRDATAPRREDAPKDVDGLIRQARQPRFISSAYFLRFHFEEGKYALVGHETVEGRDTLRIEYYPSRLFNRERRWTGHEPSDADRARAAEMERMLNKTSLVTLWIDPTANQIVKYTFNNIAFDFLPLPWLVHVNDVQATMLMGQPFEGVWLPQSVQVAAAMTIALGQFDFHYDQQYHDYRRAEVSATVHIPALR